MSLQNGMGHRASVQYLNACFCDIKCTKEPFLNTYVCRALDLGCTLLERAEAGTNSLTFIIRDNICTILESWKGLSSRC